MDRRSFLATLSAIPVGARAPLPSELQYVPYIEHRKPEFTRIQACGSCLSPTLFRAARDQWGEDCEVFGHPAQKNAWVQARIYIVSSGYSVEWNQAHCEYFLGNEFFVDYNLPYDTIEFRRKGQVIGTIAQLSVPLFYAENR